MSTDIPHYCSFRSYSLLSHSERPKAPPSVFSECCNVVNSPALNDCKRSKCKISKKNPDRHFKSSN